MKILAWIIGAPIAIIALWGVGRLLFCGPDKSIQKVTDPMATAILEYINTHGKPESLADIPNLPYKVEGCKKLAGEDKEVIEETCYFLYKEHKYSVHIATVLRIKENSISLRRIYLDIFYIDKNTKIRYYFTLSDINHKTIRLEKKYINPIRRNGFCKNGILKMA